MTAFLVPQYQNFARQMWASLQAHPGDVGYGPRASEIAAIMADWASRGLNPGILWQIMQHVWGYFFQA